MSEDLDSIVPGILFFLTQEELTVLLEWVTCIIKQQERVRLPSPPPPLPFRLAELR